MNSILYRTRYLIMLLSLTGCSLAPEYKRPDLPIADSYQITDKQLDGAALLQQDWSQFYRDERLRQLIQLALKNNRDLRIATLNSERLQGDYQIRVAQQWPTINAGIAQEHTRPEASNDQATYGVPITSYELDLFGRVQSLKEAALAEYFASIASQRAAQITIMAAVATADYSLRVDEQLLKLARSSLHTQQQKRDLLGKRVKEGLDSQAVYEQQLAMVQDAVVNVAQREQQLAQDQHALLLLLGVPKLPSQLANSTTSDQEEAISELPVLPSGLPADLLVRRPDIIALEQRLRAMNANIGAARAAFFPRITLTGSFGRASSTLSHLFEHSVRGWSFSPDLTLPLFDFGANEANLDVAKAEKDIAVAEYEKGIQTAFKEVADALTAEDSLRQMADAASTKAQALSKREAIALQRYRLGSDSQIEWLNAKGDWLEAQQIQLQSHLQQQLNRISLYKVLGGGWNTAELEKMTSH